MFDSFLEKLSLNFRVISLFEAIKVLEISPLFFTIVNTAKIQNTQTSA